MVAWLILGELFAGMRFPGIIDIARDNSPGRSTPSVSPSRLEAPPTPAQLNPSSYGVISNSGTAGWSGPGSGAGPGAGNGPGSRLGSQPYSSFSYRSEDGCRYPSISRTNVVSRPGPCACTGYQPCPGPQPYNSSTVTNNTIPWCTLTSITSHKRLLISRK